MFQLLRAFMRSRGRLTLLPGAAALALSAMLCPVVSAATQPPPAAQTAPKEVQGLPGLWRVQLRVDRPGYPGKLHVVWRCIFEGSDPWAAFADLQPPGHAACQRTDHHFQFTALSWNMRCPDTQPAQGNGRVDFDSASHYSALVHVVGDPRTLYVEGTRRASCTSPAD